MFGCIAVFVATTFGVLLLIGSSARGDQARYLVVLDALQRFDLSSQSLEELQDRLVQTGTDAREAEAAILLAVRNLRMPASLIGQTIPVARDVGAIMGVGIVSGAARLVAALTSGYDAIRQLGTEWNFLSVEDDRQIALMARHGDLLEAQKLALDRLESQFGGGFDRLRGISTEIADPSAWKAARCNANAAENERQFGLVLTELQAGSANTAAELQRVVVNLCSAGSGEAEAFSSVMAILRGK